MLDSCRRKSSSKNIPTSSSSDSDSYQPLLRKKRPGNSTEKLNARLISLEYRVSSIKTSVDCMQQCSKLCKIDPVLVSNLFMCIICKEATIDKDPVVPQCCSGIVACKECIEGWIQHSPTCPQCRCTITLDVCLPIPPYRPLSALFDNKEDEHSSTSD